MVTPTVISKPLRGPVLAVTSNDADGTNPCGDQVFPHVVRILKSYDPTTGDDPLSWCKRHCRGGWRWTNGPRGDGPWYAMELAFERPEDVVWFSMVWG